MKTSIFQRFDRYFGNYSAWLTIGMSTILIAVVLTLAMMNYNREKKYMIKILNEKGASLIRTFEAGARTGMMGKFGTLPRLETLIKETAAQQDVLYITIANSSGIILAHNNSGKIGNHLTRPNQSAKLSPTTDIQWRLVGDPGTHQTFEVYKLFLPSLRRPNQTTINGIGNMEYMGNNCESSWMMGLPTEKIFNPDNRPAIFIGMDATPFQEAIREDIKFTLILSGTLILLGMAGVVSLFWAQNSTKSKKLLGDMRAFAYEMIATLPEGIIATDNQLRIRYINQVAAEMLNIQTIDSRGVALNTVLPPAIVSLCNSSTSSGSLIEDEIEIQHADGHTFPASVIATNVLTEDQTFVGLMLIAKDLTQLKKLQFEVQRKDKLAAIGHLAAGVAHEVRNPLSSIKGYATYFKSLFAKDSENSKAADVLIAETDRLNRVITELLELSKPSDVKLRKTLLRPLLESTLRLIQHEAHSSNIHVNMKFDDEVNFAFLDPDRFTQVMVNIYVNSIQAMVNGGELSLIVSGVKNHITLTVSDTGPGLSKEITLKMFDPYFTTKTKGTGLGLSIAQKIIEAHHGTIHVNSGEGKGTSIVISLPNKLKRNG